MASRNRDHIVAGTEAPGLSRRGLIVAGASLGATGLFPACGHQNGSTVPGAQTGSAACVLRPRQGEGPYFLDEKLERSDIRSDPTDGSVKPGVPLRLVFRTLRADAACAPLPGAIIDIWQCDADGIYAGVVDGNGQFNTQGKKFLRGFQRTNAEGQGEFLTIYPGWYAGRAAHIHFKIRSDLRAGFDFASQIYFPEATNEQVFKLPPYSGKTGARSMNSQDGGFQSGGNQLTAQLTPEGNGYAALFEIGLSLA